MRRTASRRCGLAKSSRNDGERVVTHGRLQAVTARRRTAILISGRGSNMTALIAAARAPDFPAEIALVLSNKSDAAGLAFAETGGHRNGGGRSQDLRRARRIRRLDAGDARHSSHRPDLPRRLHANPERALRNALARPDHQYPSLAAARVSRARHPCAGDRGRRKTARLHGAFRRARTRFRPDHRASDRSRARRRHARQSCRAGAGRRAQALSAALALVAVGKVYGTIGGSGAPANGADAVLRPSPHIAIMSTQQCPNDFRTASPDPDGRKRCFRP